MPDESVDKNPCVMTLWRRANRERARAYSREYWANNRERLNQKKRDRRARSPDATHAEWIRQTYGVTEEWYQAQLALQGYACDICGKRIDPNSRRLSVDHDHATGKVRGLLCQRCNVLLGYAKDKTGWLLSAVAYLRKHGRGSPARVNYLGQGDHKQLSLLDLF